MLTGVGAVLNSAAFRPGESIALYGLGGVGLSALLGAVAGGAQPVVAIDPSPAKRALAIELGAAGSFTPDGVEAEIEALLCGKPDIVIETVGLPNPAEMFTIPAVSLVADGKSLIGSYLGSSIPARDIPRYIGLWRAGRLPVERLLTSVSPMSEINRLFDSLASAEAIRQIVIPRARAHG